MYKRQVGLSGFERAYPLQLSGGMQQRVALARALAYHPSFIMMDEPFAALDYFTREQMQQELLRVQRDTGASILFVTHSIDEALLLARRIAIISEGRISAEFDIDAPALGRNVMNDEFISLKRAIIAKLDSACLLYTSHNARSARAPSNPSAASVNGKPKGEYKYA